MIHCHEIVRSTHNLGACNDDWAPGGIPEIADNFPGPVGRIISDYMNNLDIIVELARNPPC
jgi:hypothetical protein